MKRVAMFVTNPCTHDARVMKEAKTLSSAGYDVRVFALSNAYNDPGVFEQDGYTVHRLKFNNIFQRGRDFFWLLLPSIFKPVGWLVTLFTEIIIVLLWGLATIPVVLLYASRKAFKLFGGALYNYSEGTAPSAAIEHRRLVEPVLLVRRIVNFTSKCIKFNLRIIKRVLKLVKAQLKWLYGRMKRSYRLIRSWMIKRINKAIYSLLLPLHKISTYYFFCRSASEEAIKWQAEIAHAHDLNTMYAAYEVKRKIGSLIIYDSHELWIHRNRVGRKAVLEKQLDKFVEWRLIRDADAVITVCESIGNWLQNRYPMISKPLILRNMPHRLEDQVNDRNAIPLKPRLNIPNDALTMIYTGKITSGRGLEIGMQALAEIPELYMVLLGYGEPNYVEEIKSLARRLDIEHRIVFCDAVPHTEVTRFIYGADFALVYIEPICLSYEYALPNKLFESVQAGIPILGSNLVEIEKIVDGYDIGLCFSDSSDLANKILRECNKVQLDKWRRSIKNAASDLCWEREQMGLIDLYSQLQLQK